MRRGVGRIRCAGMLRAHKFERCGAAGDEATHHEPKERRERSVFQRAVLQQSRVHPFPVPRARPTHPKPPTIGISHARRARTACCVVCHICAGTVLTPAPHASQCPNLLSWRLYRGIDENKCKQSLYLRRMTGHRSAQAPSYQRPRGAMLRSRRYRRLRAHVQSLSQMPISAPVNASGGQVSRNITNSGTGRTDGLRAPLRRTACTDRRKIAVSSTAGPMHQCLLGSITENAPRKVTGPRRRLGMLAFHQRWVTP